VSRLPDQEHVLQYSALLCPSLFHCLTGLFFYLFVFALNPRSVYYGPDSIHGEFEADTCAVQLGLPTCALWVPDPTAFIKLLTHEAPDFLGGWCLVGIIAASMSTADGAILAMGTVMSHNVMRSFDRWYPNLVTADNLLFMARTTTLPFTLISTLIAAYYKNSGSAAGATGYLLIVAFDIVFATVVVPLFGCFYCKNPSPRAAVVGILGGIITRVVLEFALPKDGLLLLPFDDPTFLDVGPAASSLLPSFIDADPADYWNPENEACTQETFEDYTGVDSLAAPLVNLILFVSIQFLENYRGKALFEFGGSEGYIKNTTEHPIKHDLSHTGNASTGSLPKGFGGVEYNDNDSGDILDTTKSSAVNFVEAEPEVIPDDS
jgi:hypothetical protein